MILGDLSDLGDGLQMGRAGIEVAASKKGKRKGNKENGAERGRGLLLPWGGRPGRFVAGRLVRVRRRGSPQMGSKMVHKRPKWFESCPNTVQRSFRPS